VRRFLTVLAPFIAALAIAAAACGGDDESNPSGSPVIHTLAPLSSTAPDISADFSTVQDGLQIATITEGAGAQVASGDLVTVNYSGWIKDGQLFDSSLKQGRTPFQFILGSGNVIQGWDIGVAQMKVGGVYRLIIAPALAYGSQGQGAAIPPNATLVFDISVLSTTKPTPEPTRSPVVTVNSTPPPVSQTGSTLSDGLQFFTISEGTGELPQAHDIVTVNYTGWVQNGGQFDTTYGREPFSFPIGEGTVIRGFGEGVALMKVGGNYRLIIPPDIGYGQDGSPPYIGPNATLIMDVTIVSIEPPPSATATP
jgi:peptidylprolyl isomerase